MDPTSAALLRQTTDGLRAVAKAKELVGSRVAPDFRLFDFLRDDEIAISRCLAFLLDDRETHGQRGLYLDSFLRKLGPPIRWASSRVLQRVSVEERISGSGRRIDILLQFAGGNFIGIENKPWARDQEDQLKDYGHHLKYLAENTAEAVGNWCLVYLSNRDPEPSSLNEEVRDAWTKSANYIHLDFRKIVDWLDSCASATEASTVRTFLEQFVQFIRHMVNEEKCMSLEQREVIDTILRSSENIDSAFRVAASVDDVKKKLLSKFEGELRQLIEEDGWELIWNFPEVRNGLEKMAKEASFGIAFDPRDDKVLTFEFSESGLRDM